MIATILAYLAYRELRDQNTEPETSEELWDWILKGIAVILFWPYFLARLERYQETQGQKNRLVVSVCVLALISLTFSFYLILGIFIGLVRMSAFLYHVYRIQQEKEKSL